MRARVVDIMIILGARRKGCLLSAEESNGLGEVGVPLKVGVLPLTNAINN